MNMPAPVPTLTIPVIIPRLLINHLAVVDKTGRIQRLTTTGERLLTWRMPATAAGYPTGLTFGPDGNWYVADTHYHRVMVYTPEGRLVRRFGEFGQGDGQFIFPTDVAFAPDGRIFVAEFGGNDRISIFSPEGKFIRHRLPSSRVFSYSKKMNFEPSAFHTHWLE